MPYKFPWSVFIFFVRQNYFDLIDSFRRNCRICQNFFDPSDYAGLKGFGIFAVEFNEKLLSFRIHGFDFASFKKFVKKKLIGKQPTRSCRLNLKLFQHPAGLDVLVEGGGGNFLRQFSFGEDANHRGVVGAEGLWREVEAESVFFAREGELQPQGAVAGDAAGQGDAPDAVSFGRTDGFRDEHLDYGGLDAGAEVADFLRVLQQHRVVAQKIADGGFQSAEAEVVASVVQ